MNLLLSNGARVSQGNYCALLKAASANRPDIFEKLLTGIAVDHKLLVIFGEAFVLCSGTDIIRFLIDMMSRWPVQFPPEISGLLLSSSSAFPEKMEYLLRIGADPRRKYKGDTIGETRVADWSPGLLSNAIKQRAFKTVDLLLQYGADVDACDGESGTPLYAAMKINDLPLARKLLACGANPNQDIWMHKSCWKLLHLAVANNDLSFLVLFVEEGADLEARCDFCPSPLWPAIKNENSQMIQYLVEKGADINDCEIYGRTLLYRAEQHHLDDACKILSNLGALHETTETIRQKCIENTVHRLSRQLMLPSSAEAAESSEMWSVWLSHYRWIFLGRSLYLGNDCVNAIIALEQSFRMQEIKGGEQSLSTWVICALCNLLVDGTFHLCKDSEERGICHKYCLQKHEAQLKEDGVFDTHEHLTYPRDFLLKVPKDHVSLSENEFVPLTTWLEGLATWKVRQSEDTQVEGDREAGSV